MNRWLVAAALNGAIAVAAGAFAAHSLRGELTPESLRIFDTAARYQMYHALALGLCSVRGVSAFRIPALCFLAGIVLFSGSLYAFALTGLKAFGYATPFGGIAFLAGWLALAWSAWRRRDQT
jgi:uncharacterized membrane protein YgdD (TMEM256/DUF423 family)